MYRVDNAPTFRQGLWTVTSRIGKGDRNETFRINCGRIFEEISLALKRNFEFSMPEISKILDSIFIWLEKGAPVEFQCKTEGKISRKKETSKRARKLIKKLKKILKKKEIR